MTFKTVLQLKFAILAGKLIIHKIRDITNFLRR